MRRLQFQFNEADELEVTNHYSRVNFPACKAKSLNELKAEYSTFVCSDRPTENVIKCVCSIGIPYSLVSDNAKTFTSCKITHLLEIQGCEKLDTPQYAGDLMALQKELYIQ